MNNVARALVDRLTVKFAGEIAQDTDGYDLFKLCDGAWGGGWDRASGGEGHQSIFYKLGRLKPVNLVNKHAKFIETLNLYIQVKLPVNKCIETLNLYIQVKLPVKINLNYLQVSKYYIKKTAFSQLT